MKKPLQISNNPGESKLNGMYYGKYTSGDATTARHCFLVQHAGGKLAIFVTRPS